MAVAAGAGRGRLHQHHALAAAHGVAILERPGLIAILQHAAKQRDRLVDAADHAVSVGEELHLEHGVETGSGEGPRGAIQVDVGGGAAVVLDEFGGQVRIKLIGTCGPIVLLTRAAQAD